MKHTPACRKVIRTVLNDNVIRQNLIVLGKEQSQKFTVEKLAHEHLFVFKLALKTFNKRRYLLYKFLYEPIHSLTMHIKK